MRPGNTVAPDANKVSLSYINTLICISMDTTGTGDQEENNGTTLAGLSTIAGRIISHPMWKKRKC